MLRLGDFRDSTSRLGFLLRAAKANKAPEPTPGLVTSRAGARLAPIPVVAHL